MGNLEEQVTLGKRHRTETNKTKQNATQKTKYKKQYGPHYKSGENLGEYITGKDALPFEKRIC